MMNKNRARLLRPPSKMWLVLSAVLLLAGLGFLGAFGYAQYQYYKSGSLYTELRQVAVSAVSETEQTEQIDFTALQEINPDVAAWLEIPGLDLSLPVVQAQDNQTYLHRSFDGSESPAGCLFFAAPTGGDEELYRVIYGHNLHDGSMFSGLLNYRDEEFYREHPTFTLYTPEGAQTWRIFSCHAATDTEELYRTGRTEGAEYDAFLQELQAMSEYDTGVDLPAGARALTLSTCLTSYGSGLERFVVHAYREE
ncbi:class B sortase [Gemmiger formicilis]